MWDTIRGIAASWGLFALAVLTRHFLDRPSPIHLAVFAVVGIAGSGYFAYLFVKSLPSVVKEAERTRKMADLISLEIQERKTDVRSPSTTHRNQ